MSEQFPSLPDATLAAANRLGQWLALDDLPHSADAGGGYCGAGGQCGDPDH